MATLTTKLGPSRRESGLPRHRRPQSPLQARRNARCRPPSATAQALNHRHRLRPHNEPRSRDRDPSRTHPTAAHVDASFSPTTPKLGPERVLVALDAVTRVSRRVSRSARNFTECSTPFELEKKDNRSSRPWGLWITQASSCSGGSCLQQGYPPIAQPRRSRVLAPGDRQAGHPQSQVCYPQIINRS